MVGKRIGKRTYAHVSLLDDLADLDRKRIDKAIQVSGLKANEHFHVVRLDHEHDEVALLSYPTFLEELFPSLLASWRVHLPTDAIRFRDYSSSLNPPILHRKELMIPKNHPDQERLQRVTSLAESLGLFDDPVRIGFRNQWTDLVLSKGYQIVDQDLVPIGNLQDASVRDPLLSRPTNTPVLRHLTALSRAFLSAPVQALLRHELLGHSHTFFDYGCGKGDDIEGVRSLGIAANGWDPHYLSNEEVLTSDVVNLGFVINVIENIDERIEALQRAYELARGVLSVSAMLWSANAAKGRPYGDGYLTSRNTFQKYFSQGELQNFIESVLDEQAIPVGPGIFFVFKNRYLEQQFLSGRQLDPSRAPRLLAARQILPKALRARSSSALSQEDDPARIAEAQSIWNHAISLGRLPDQDEYPRASTALAMFGSWQKALRAATQNVDHTLLGQAASARSDELRAFFAMQAFGRRKTLKDLEPRLRRDTRAFFGSLAVAETEGRRLLHLCADVGLIKAASQRAASLGLGWLDGDHSLQLHTSLVSRLDPVLRVYVGCSTTLYGDVLSADLVKIHIQSGKITLMKFDDFFGVPLPRMVERVKVKLRDQDLDIFEYGGQFKPPFLYFKSRFINEEFPHFAEQLEFDRQLTALGLPMTDGFGPAPDDLPKWLQSQRLEIGGMRLVPTTRIPTLDEPCGRYFTFRQLIECGSTWQRTRVDNTPRLPETFNALFDLARHILDPVTDYFGAIKLTYGFTSSALAGEITSGIAPKLDQHASCELGKRGSLICSRKGAAVDFVVEYENMKEVAQWIAANCSFDRLYFYGENRPIHVSYGPDMSFEAFEVAERNGRRVPRKLNLAE